MSQYPIDNVRITKIHQLIKPQQLIDELPGDARAQHIFQSRRAICDIIQKKDRRLLVVVGPCSIHCESVALQYASRLSELSAQLGDALCLVMRVYFEKPRTTVGWKGLINDPNLDGSFDINHGLRLARKILLEINTLEVPCATEFLDVFSPQYYADLISWGAIGARTVESQLHRELASGLSCPIGFKNNTGGNTQVAIDAVLAASREHNFLSIDKGGDVIVSQTAGNRDCHIILRGGSHGANFDKHTIATTVEGLQKQQLPTSIMIDCSHSNSNKDYRNQSTVCDAVCAYLHEGCDSVIGLMLESNLIAGQQKFAIGKELVFGQSITDSCIGWEETVEVLHTLAAAVRAARLH